MQQKTLPVSIRMPEWLIKEIDITAQNDDRDRTYIINKILGERFGKKRSSK